MPTQSAVKPSGFRGLPKVTPKCCKSNNYRDETSHVTPTNSVVFIIDIGQWLILFLMIVVTGKTKGYEIKSHDMRVCTQYDSI